MTWELVLSSLAPQTRKTYKRFMKRFQTFCQKANNMSVLPSSVHMIAEFISYLYVQQYSASSISSHLSAIAFCHKLAGFDDPCQNFVVQRAILGCRKKCKVSDSRMPILLEDLHRMVFACQHLFHNFEKHLFQAIFLVAYHGFFRIGELLPNEKGKFSKVVQLEDVEFRKHVIYIHLHFYKTRKSSREHLISIYKTGKKFCPHKALKRYVKLRGHHLGPLFLTSEGSPVSTMLFSRSFSKVIEFIGLSPRVYKPHSFRIGACSQAILSGMPVSTVMALGRWSSFNAFKRYIRP